MKTIKYQEIEGRIIYTGFDTLPADPVATQKVADAAIAETDEYKTIAKKAAEKQQHVTKAAEFKKKAVALYVAAEQAKAIGDNTNAAKFEAGQVKAEQEMKNYQGAAGVLNSELQELKPAFTELVKQTRRDNRQFVGARKNEIIADSAIVEAIIAADLAKEENTVLELDTEIQETITIAADDKAGTGEEQVLNLYSLKSSEVTAVPDYRGKQYFYKADGVWCESEVISSIGVTKNTVVVDKYQDVCIEKNDLSDVQREEIRIQKLTAEELQTEYESRYNSLVSQAAQKKNELEITGSSSEEALSAAQEWLATETAVLKALYGVE